VRLSRSTRKLISAFAIVGVTFGAIELMLRVFDPWGLKYFTDLVQMSDEMYVPDAQRVYGIRDGTYHFSHWSAQVENGMRVTPATNLDSTCVIAFLGDSVTFGYGVEDDQTWVNLVAQGLPNVQVRNYGVTQYNSTNVLGTRQAYPDYSAYIYTIVQNDVEPVFDPATTHSVVQGAGQPWMVQYMQVLLRRGRFSEDPNADLENTADVDRFFSEVDALLAAGRTHLVAFNQDMLTQEIVKRNDPVLTVDYPPNHAISLVDQHLNPEGNRELADSVLPLIRDIAEQTCL